MTAFLVECPACHISFPVDRETMRVEKATAVVDLDEFTVGEGAVIGVDVYDADRCQSPSCGCNRPEPAA